MTLNGAPIETSDVQGLLVTAYAKREYALYLLLRVREPVVAGAALEQLLPRIATASHDAQVDPAINIAFSSCGLAALGLSRSVRGTFSPAFADGVAGSEYRSRILGDEGESDPAVWTWGNCTEPVHIIVLVFASTPDGARHAANDVLGKFGASVLEVVKGGIAAGFLSRPAPSDPEKKVHYEHFGFADGLAQPQFERRSREATDPVRAGEFVMGYPDESDSCSAGPTVPSSLPGYGLPKASDGSWDFGRNGSYLVARQIEEHVDRFWNYLLAEARRLGNGATPLELAERMIGRRLDGAPLVPSLKFKEDDPKGLSCPFGAHIRRVNPRDHLGTDQRNRHRLLRRGRTYGPEFPYPPCGPGGITKPIDDDGKSRGLVFLALNADIERQFEFIHQNWINHGAFHGLLEERDPIVGARQRRDVMTMPGNPLRRRLQGLQPFATVVGGEYFFLPGIKGIGYIAANAQANAAAVYRGTDAVRLVGDGQFAGA